MKLEVTSGEARLIVLDQVKAVTQILTEVTTFIENGQVQKAYERCNFDLIMRMSRNLENWASDSDQS